MDASTNMDLPADQAVPTAAPEELEKEKQPRFELDMNKIVHSPSFYPGIAIFLAIAAAFWTLIARLPDIWFGEDGYYSHGVLVPLISGYVIYRWWPWLKKIPVKPCYPAIIPLVFVFPLILRAFEVNHVEVLTSISLVFALLVGITFVAGWRWMFGLALPTLYLAFALPMWTMAITYWTNPLQVTSAKIAFKMLELTGFDPIKDPGGNVIDLFGNYHFVLDVGIPCSGLKLVLALYAFTFFFVLIARLRWWANLLMIFAVPLPLALFINGLRIMLIGVVGVNYGPEAGTKFHDWSGYITLVVCFFILFRVARWLGWKD